MAKPTIVLVPGAWHKAFESFHLLTTLLVNHGYVVEAVPLASVGQSLPRLGFEEDVKNVATVVEKHADQGSDIVVLFHSYGGVPGSSACRHLLKSDRSAVGKAGGITHVVYCAAFAIGEGRCLMDGMGGQPLPWWVFDESKESMMPEDPENTFYSDIDDQEMLRGLVAGLKLQSFSAFWGKATYMPWLYVNSTYILCSKDNALPLQVQEGMMMDAKKAIQASGSGATMKDVTLSTSHSPFMSQPQRVADILRRIAGETV